MSHLPIRSVVRPAVLADRVNGRLPDSILVNTPGLAGGPVVRLVEPAARAWRALQAAASAAGHTLKATSLYDSYRPYDVQVSTFLRRHQTDPIAGVTPRWWQGVAYYLKPGYAPAAVPGTSNHGWGLAIDVGEERDGDTGTESIDAGTLAWLVEHELDYGFSHELEVEPWHVRYFRGDDIPTAVLSYEEDNDMATAEEIAKAVWDLKLTRYNGAADAPRMGGAMAMITARSDYLANRLGLAGRLDQIAADAAAMQAAAAADETRDAAMLAAIRALAESGGVDAAPIVAAVREEAERTRGLVAELRATVVAQEAELDELRARLAAAAQAEADTLAAEG